MDKDRVIFEDWAQKCIYNFYSSWLQGPIIRCSSICRSRTAITHPTPLVPIVWLPTVVHSGIQGQRAQGHVPASPVARQPTYPAVIAISISSQWLQLSCSLNNVRHYGGILCLDTLEILRHQFVDSDIPSAGSIGSRVLWPRRVGHTERQKGRRRARQREGDIVGQLAPEQIAERVVEFHALQVTAFVSIHTHTHTPGEDDPQHSTYQTASLRRRSAMESRIPSPSLSPPASSPPAS